MTLVKSNLRVLIIWSSLSSFPPKHISLLTKCFTRRETFTHQVQNSPQLACFPLWGVLGASSCFETASFLSKREKRGSSEVDIRRGGGSSHLPARLRHRGHSQSPTLGLQGWVAAQPQSSLRLEFIFKGFDEMIVLPALRVRRFMYDLT